MTAHRILGSWARAAYPDVHNTIRHRRACISR